MGTPMAVSFANLFMSKFETNLLDDYKKEYQKGPVMWIRYIDDVFFVWDHNQEELMHFLSYCNSYAAKNSYKSTIKFTMEYSKSDVVFLDTKVKTQNKNKGRRETLLFRQRDTLRTKEVMETRLSKLNSLPQYGRLLRYLLLTGISEKILRKSKRKSHFRMYKHTFHIK